MGGKKKMTVADEQAVVDQWMQQIEAQRGPGGITGSLFLSAGYDWYELFKNLITELDVYATHLEGEKQKIEKLADGKKKSSLSKELEGKVKLVDELQKILDPVKEREVMVFYPGNTASRERVTGKLSKIVLPRYETALTGAPRERALQQVRDQVVRGFGVATVDAVALRTRADNDINATLKKEMKQAVLACLVRIQSKKQELVVRRGDGALARFLRAVDYIFQAIGLDHLGVTGQVLVSKAGKFKRQIHHATKKTEKTEKKRYKKGGYTPI
jgi:hypothetical protein